MKLFLVEEIILQHKFLDYFIGIYFPEYRLAIEIDERGHLDRNEEKEKERENEIKEKLKCEFIKINPDKKNFDEYVEFGKILTL